MVELVARHAAEHPDKPCLIDGSQSVSYGDYWRMIYGYSEYLRREVGLRPGECVVVRAAQSIAFLASELAIQLAGGVFVPVEKVAGTDRVLEIARSTEARLFLALKPLEGGTLTHLPLGEVPRYQSAAWPDPAGVRFPDPEASSEILFTTGTTGKSKGIELSFKSEVAVAENVRSGVSMEPDNVELIPMPVNHSYGLRRYYGNILNGSTVVLMDGVVFVERLFQALDRHGVTSMALVPAALSVLIKLSKDRLGRYAGQLRYIQIGTAPLSDADKEQLCALLPGIRLYDFYGSTETGCALITEFGRRARKKGCIGRPTVNARLMIAGEDGAPVESSIDRPGLIALSGDMAMKGYWQEPELTRASMRGGYVYSSDLGYIDPEGDVILLGRQGDVINCGGNKISPTEIEAAALKIPAVRDCACVPQPDPVMGQVPKLFVSLNPGEPFRPSEILSALGGALEAFKVPKSIELLEEIPRSFNGKILRRELTGK